MLKKVFIGYDSIEPAAYHVLCHSIMRHASGPIAFIPLVQSQLRARGLYTRKRDRYESTEFSLTRFLVPYLSNYEGVSIFMDCDMLCKDDLYALPEIGEKAVLCVQHDYVPSTDVKMEGALQSVYPRKNWSSLMVFDNAKCKALTPHFVSTALPGALHQFGWLRSEDIGMLPLEWNHLVGEYLKNDGAKMLHYTLGGPWFRDHQFCDHAQEWFDELDLAFPSMNVPKPVGA